MKDTSHAITILENTPLPEDNILATIDISSLHTNKPQEEGIQACLSEIENNHQSHLPKDTLQTLFQISLQHR